MHPGLQARSIHREDERLKEGGLIMMRRTLVLLATMALVVVASGSLAVAASSLNNGNFETGNLSGWTVDATNGATASVVGSYFYYHNPACEAYCSYNTILPHEGSSFALLISGNQQTEVTRISQPFEASNGDKISGWAFFRSSVFTLYDSTGANDDKAQVVIKSDSGTTVATPFEQSVSSVGTGGDGSGWMYWEYTFTGLTGTGQFQIEARLHKPGPSICRECSVMGLDDVKTSIAGPDTTPPETYITSGLGHISPGEAGITDSTSATFEFHSNEQGSTFKCQLSKDDAVVQAWADCTSPKSYSNLSRAEQWETLYEFEVRATDPAGNVDPTPARRYWFVKRGTETQPPPQPPPDTTAPETSIDSGSSGTVKQDSATFSFSSSEANSTFQCKLDSAAFSACSLPKNYTGLAKGSHTFRVRATDAAGNTDASPASRTWKVVR
jgi:hypothetical protein